MIYTIGTMTRFEEGMPYSMMVTPLTDANQRWNSGEQCLTSLKEGTRGTIGKFNTRSSHDSIKFVLNKTLRILEVLGV